MNLNHSKTKFNILVYLVIYLSVFGNEAINFESKELHNINEIASLLHISIQSIPDTPSMKLHFLNPNEDRQLDSILLRPVNIQQNHTIFGVFNKENKRIAFGHYYEMPTTKSAQLRLLADLSYTSMPLHQMVERLQIINGIGDLCIGNKGYDISFLNFTRNGCFIKLKAQGNKSQLAEIAKAIDDELVHEIAKFLDSTLVKELQNNSRKESSNLE